jgi:cytochrome c
MGLARRPTRERCAVGTAGSVTMRNAALLAAAILVMASTQAGWAQDVAKGERSFKKCVLCHAIGPDARNKVGPELNGLDGRRAGTAADYGYSDATKNSRIVWSESTFKQYIKDPGATIPGTKKVFAGVKDDQEVNDLWAYIKQFDANGNAKK